MTAAACQEKISAGSGMWGSTAPQMPAAERTRLADQIRRFYKGQNYQLVWLDGDRPAGRYQELIKVFNTANEQGLPTDLYHVTLENPTPESDVKTTATSFRYFFHLTGAGSIRARCNRCGR